MTSEPESAVSSPPTLPATRDPLAALWEASTLRLRCAAVTQSVANNLSGNFKLNRDPLRSLAQDIAADWRAGLPELRQALLNSGPWGLWAAHAPARLAAVEAAMDGQEPLAAAQAWTDVLLLATWMADAPGPAWSFVDHPDKTSSVLAMPVQRQNSDDLLALLNQASGAAKPEDAAVPNAAPETPPVETLPGSSQPVPRLYGRAGVAVALLKAFQDGVFSNDGAQPLRVDGRVLVQIDAAALRAIFHSATGAAFPGLATWVDGLRRWGNNLETQARASGGSGRPSMLLDEALRSPPANDAENLLRLTTRRLAAIEPDGLMVLGLPAGDVRSHRWAGRDTACGPHAATAEWVPLHQRSRNVVLALARPLQPLGLELQQVQTLPAGGDLNQGHVFLDRGIVQARASRDLSTPKQAHDEWITEWRALSLSLMDELAAHVRAELQLDEHRLPTWLLTQHPALHPRDKPVVPLLERKPAD